MRHGRLIITPDGTVKEEEGPRKSQAKKTITSVLTRRLLLSRLLDPVTTDKTLVITPFVADDEHAT